MDPLADRLRDALEGVPGISERRMFGGLCLMVNGNMLAGVHGAKAGGGAMFRVGPAAEAAALALPGVAPMTMTGRRMGGFVDVPPEALDDTLLARLTAMALAFAGSLPPKPRGPGRR